MLNPDFGPEIVKGGPLWRSDELRPGWLADDVLCLDRWGNEGGTIIWAPAVSIQWGKAVAIRLPASHPASLCAQRALDHPEEEPFYPWMGGEEEPVDWDQGDVLFADGQTDGHWTHWNWTHEGPRRPPSSRRIVGYRRKPSPASEGVDPDLIEARGAAASVRPFSGNSALILIGDRDGTDIVRAALAGIKRGRELAAPAGDAVTIAVMQIGEALARAKEVARTMPSECTTAKGYARRERAILQAWEAIGALKVTTLSERYARETGRPVNPDIEHALEWAVREVSNG